MHVLDQTNSFVKDEFGNMIPDDTPRRYNLDGLTYGYCLDDVIETSGEVLFSGSYMEHQKSCKPSYRNAGNYYTWQTSVTGRRSQKVELNSICSKGWQLADGNTTVNNKNHDFLVRDVYGILENNNDSRVQSMPLSYIRSGYYGAGILKVLGEFGYYWSAMAGNGTAAFVLVFNGASLDTMGGRTINNGFAIRCVAR